MARITNNERADLILPTGHVVPRMRELVTTNDLIRSADNWPFLSGRMLAGQIGIELDPDEPAPAPAPTPAKSK
jgi:hypothetical protein